MVSTGSSSATGAFGSGAGGAGSGGASVGAGGAATSASATGATSGSGAGGTAPGGGTGGAQQPPSDGFDAFQHHNLDVVNQYRATLGLTPLMLDSALCAFALAGSQELESDHTPHAHFNAASADGSLWQDGFQNDAGENQGDPNGWTPLASDPTDNEMQQIDAIQAAMFAEGPGTGEAHGHYENIMSTQFTRLGVGLIEVDGRLYLTNDFSG